MKNRLLGLVRERRFDELMMISLELSSRPGETGSALDAAVEELARMAAVGAALTAIRIGSLRDSARPSPATAGELASRLGFSQSLEALIHGAREADSGSFAERVVAAWMHERVLRFDDVAGEPSLREFWRRPGVSDSELAFLPLRRLPSERNLEACMPRYGGSVISRHLPSRPAQDRGTSDSRGALPPDVMREELRRDQVLESVLQWQAVSNGRLEARIAHFRNPAVLDVHVPCMLHSLDLECLRGTPPSEVLVKKSSFPATLASLFSAASSGGAYGGGAYGALGRLRAWKSAAALCGSPAAGPEAVEGAADLCEWFEFDTRDGWFDHVAWDLAVACVRADRGSVAILAATDTD